MLFDFALVGEDGKMGIYGLKQKQLDARFVKEYTKDSNTTKHIDVYNQSKITLMIEMIQRIIKCRFHFDYVLIDNGLLAQRSYCSSLPVTSSDTIFGMIKMSKTKYTYKDKVYTAKQLVTL